MGRNKEKEAEDLKVFFEEKYLKGTCFDSLQELKDDKTTVDVNIVRALIAVELWGIWKGLNGLASFQEYKKNKRG